MPSKPPRTELEELHKVNSDDSSSSNETITGTKGRMEFFGERAEEQLRYHLMKEEGGKSGNVGELEMEVKGKKVWRVGGVGMWAYSMDPEEEKVKSGLWRKLSKSHGREDWLASARARTALYMGGMFDLLMFWEDWLISQDPETSLWFSGNWSKRANLLHQTHWRSVTRPMVNSSTPPGHGSTVVSILESGSIPWVLSPSLVLTM